MIFQDNVIKEYLKNEKAPKRTVDETAGKAERHFGFVKNDFRMDTLEIKK